MTSTGHYAKFVDNSKKRHLQNRCNDAFAALTLINFIRLALINFRSRCLLILKRYLIAVILIFTVSRVIQGNVTHCLIVGNVTHSSLTVSLKSLLI